MKGTILTAFFLALFALIFPIALSVGNPLPKTTNNGKAASASPAANGSSDAGNSVNADDNVSVRVLVNDSVQEMTMTDYLLGVVSAGMPATFEPEALKAQTVAARTYTLYKKLVSPNTSHPQADMCTDITCCNAYTDPKTLPEKWGADYNTYIAKMKDAIHATDGVTMLYADKPILAVFHSSSSGRTEDSAAVWGGTAPYLKSVLSPETAEQVPNYVSSVTVSISDFEKTIQTADNKAVFGTDKSKWVLNVVRTDSGRLKSLTIGGIPFTGTNLRSLFDLRSAAIDLKVTDNGIILTTTGYGHGVGMSQYGANTLAKQGYQYIDILKWYYTGISIGNEKDLF